MSNYLRTDYITDIGKATVDAPLRAANLRNVQLQNVLAEKALRGAPLRGRREAEKHKADMQKARDDHEAALAELSEDERKAELEKHETILSLLAGANNQQTYTAALEFFQRMYPKDDLSGIPTAYDPNFVEMLGNYTYEGKLILEEQAQKGRMELEKEKQKGQRRLEQQKQGAKDEFKMKREDAKLLYNQIAALYEHRKDPLTKDYVILNPEKAKQAKRIVDKAEQIYRDAKGKKLWGEASTEAAEWAGIVLPTAEEMREVAFDAEVKEKYPNAKKEADGNWYVIKNKKKYRIDKK